MEEITQITQEESNTDSERKLASVQEVLDVRPHPDPKIERLELATVEGWQVVIAKGEVKKGDKVIYCEIDSLLPGDAPWLPPAIKKRVDQQKDKSSFRVKTIRLQKELSQGLLISLDQDCFTFDPKTCELEDDLTEKLGIKKYERPLNAVIVSKGSFPTHLLGKTDEVRIQNKTSLLQIMRDRDFYATLKLDGTSGTFLIDPDTNEFLVCSRNQICKEPEDLSDIDSAQYWWRIAVKCDLEEKLRRFPRYAVQGEICGPGIQKNPLQLKDLEFFVFNVVDLKTKKRLDFDELVATCSHMGLDMVPVEEDGDAGTFDYTLEGIKARANGRYPALKGGKGGKRREGLVFRTKDQTPQNAISWKIVSDEFLEKDDK